MKPFIKWAGGKTALLEILKAEFPPGTKRVIEPFLGGGALLLGHPFISVVSDLNTRLIETYEVVRDEPLSLIEELDKHAHLYSEEYFYYVRGASFPTATERAAQFIFLNKTCFNGLYRENRKGQFNVPFCKKTTCPTIYDKANILEVSERLKQVTIVSQDFETTMNVASRGDLIYCDPPYHSTFTQYQPNGFTEQEQTRLRDCAMEAKNRGCSVLISNSDTPFIRNLYKDFCIKEIKAPRQIAAQGQSRNSTIELLIK